MQVHGPALRWVRELMGLAPEDLARAMRCRANFVIKLELGYSRACSPGRFALLVEYLQPPDPRALLADPWSSESAGADVPTGPMPRVPAQGRHRADRAVTV